MEMQEKNKFFLFNAKLSGKINELKSALISRQTNEMRWESKKSANYCVKRSCKITKDKKNENWCFNYSILKKNERNH